jgi:hypothetical protein
MEGRAGLSRPTFYFAGPLGFCWFKRNPLQCFEIPGVENAGGEPRKHPQFKLVPGLILRFSKN